MKSRLFGTVFDDPESDHAKKFARHLQESLELGDAALRSCVEALPKLKELKTSKQGREFVESLAGEIGQQIVPLDHALTVTNFLVDALLNPAIPEDDPDYWEEDLLEMGWIEETSRTAFESYLAFLRKSRASLKFQDQERSASGGVLPCFNSFGATVEVRPIRGDIYRWGQTIDEYEPEILGTVTVASISIGLDVGLVKDVHFQADESQIDNIIDSLLAVKKEMAALSCYLCLDSKGNIGPND